MAQLKDNNNNDVMPKTTADNVQYDSNYSVAQKIAQIEQGGGGSSSIEDAGEAYPNLLVSIERSKGFVYNNGGVYASNSSYDSAVIELEFDTYYSIADYINLQANARQVNSIALFKGTGITDNLKASDFVEGSAWLLQDTVFNHNADRYNSNIFNPSIAERIVFKTPKSSELTSVNNLYLVINVRFYSISCTDTLKVTKSMFPINYSGIKGKNVAFFGDSITAGTEGGFVGKVQSKARLNIATNYGSSGAASGRLASIMLGNPFRESSNVSYKDYMMYQAVVIQIGTNGGVTGNIDNDIPDIGIYDISGYPYEYSASGKTIASATVNEPIEFFTKCFANTYYGNVALCIEYVRYINPNCRIFLTTIPHNIGGYGNFDTVRNAVLNIAKKMGVQVIDAGAYAGLGRWNMTYWCSDAASATARTHLNAKGNEMWASYIAHELERLWYNTNIED